MRKREKVNNNIETKEKVERKMNGWERQGKKSRERDSEGYQVGEKREGKRRSVKRRGG